MTREEFIRKAVDAHFEAQATGYKVRPLDREIIRPLVEAALDAVGAWETRRALEALTDDDDLVFAPDMGPIGEGWRSEERLKLWVDAGEALQIAEGK